MNTEIGKFLKMLRIENGENMKDMSTKLDVSTAFLSSVECGKKPVPKNWEELISNIYNLSKEKQEELENAINLTNNKVSIDLKDLSKEKQDVSLMFARSIKDCDPDLLKKLKELLNEEKR